MPYFRVDDGFDGHPKTVKAGDDSIGMWVRAGAWCMRYLTDGFVPSWWVKQQPRGTAKAKSLIEAGLWYEAENAGEEGFLFHEWRQDSKEKVEADRQKARDRQAKSRGLSRRDITCDSHEECAQTPGYIPLPIPLSDTYQGTNGTLVEGSGETPAKAGAKRRKQISPDYMPQRHNIDKIKTEFPAVPDSTLRSVHEDFCLYWQGQGRPMADWDATWLRWTRKELAKHTNNGHSVNGVGKATQKALGYRALGEKLIQDLKDGKIS